MTRRLPDRMPIVARGAPPFQARELTEPVDLCDAAGRLNPAAVGWARQPVVRANLAGHWPRKKRWNFWNWISPRFVLQATLADIDYAAFCQITFIDFVSRRTLSALAPAWPGSLGLPEHVERTVRFESRRVRYANVQDGGVMRVAIDAAASGGERIAAELVVRTPAGQESLNVVVPWSATRFQSNSKHAALPCEGEVRVGDLRYELIPETCHAVQDFGRGLWPYRSFWNWGVATGVQDGVRVGVNVGGRWTAGTGVTENGILLDGRLHRIADEVRWAYDPDDWMAPWRVVDERTGMVDLTLEPLVAHRTRTSLGVLASGGVCCFGRWHGTVRAGDRTLALRDVMGWAEEFAHRW